MMDWKKLLSTRRVREMYGVGGPTRLPEDPRTEFERDYGRAIFSTPVRRLQDKAQVFPLERHDAVRTRLTHSMEVSSVARGLAGAAAQWMLQESLINEALYVSAITTIATTCGLIHDIGNPPFGHAGEVAIADWFEEKLRSEPDFFNELAPESPNPRDTQFAKDFLKFEGNAQTQRLLSKLQILADRYGLNLTCATLSASCKYTARSDETDKTFHERSKPGFFASENELIEKVRKETGTLSARNPITYLVEASDDIVYSTVDLEDGVKKGVLTWEIIEKELPKHAGGKLVPIDRAIAEAHKKIDEAGLTGPSRGEAMAQAFRTFAIGEGVKAALEVFKTKYDQIMSGTYHGELLKDSEASGLIASCKKLGRDFVYVSDETLKLEIQARHIIHELMDLFWKAASQYAPDAKLTDFPPKVYKLASANYRVVFEDALKSSAETNIPQLYSKLQLVTDQISGMTDTYACTLHKSLTNG